MDTRTLEDFEKRKSTRRYGFINTTKYKYYRWNITATHWDHYLEIGEFRLLTVPEDSQKLTPPTTITTTKQDGLTLILVDKTKGMNAQQKKKMTSVFFKNYQILMKEFNPEAIKTIYFKIDPDYTGVAFADAAHGMVHYGGDYINKNTEDIDVVTHEVMHIIQNYPSGPGWVTEGMADYVRHLYGKNNEAVGWALHAPLPGESYKNGYGVMARFYLWLEYNVKKGIVKKVNSVMHAGTYTDQFWANETGKNIDQLWADYIKNPDL